jgi:hypothetical protein
MTKAGYAVATSAAVALTATTARTALMVITPSSFGGDLQGVSLSFDGITSTDKPVLCELVTSTNATNSTPGTNNTSESSNIRQLYGRSITTGFTAFSASTSEPTVLTAVRKWDLTPVGGTIFLDFSFGRTPDWAVSAGMGIRLTAPTSAVNAIVEMTFERC